MLRSFTYKHVRTWNSNQKQNQEPRDQSNHFVFMFHFRRSILSPVDIFLTPWELAIGSFHKFKHSRMVMVMSSIQRIKLFRGYKIILFFVLFHVDCRRRLLYFRSFNSSVDMYLIFFLAFSVHSCCCRFFHCAQTELLKDSMKPMCFWFLIFLIPFKLFILLSIFR